MTPDTPPAATTAMPGNPDPVLHRLRRLLQTMPIVQTLGLEVCAASATDVVVELPMQPALCFRPGQLQATAVFAAADFAAVAAAAVRQPDTVTSTTDTTLKLVAPASGARLRAIGRVLHAGPRSSVCQADVMSVDADGEARLCATLLATAHHARATPPATA